MGQRSRRKRRAADEPQRAAPAGSEPPQPRAARAPRQSSSERDQRIRAELEPVTPGERPAALLIAIAIATLFGVSNAVLYFAGIKIQGKRPAPGVLSFSVVMLIAAAGMYQLRYWAVLGFQALLALIVLIFCLFLVRASNFEALALCVVVIGGGGLLFYKMVKVLARIQLPTRPSR